MQDSRTQGTQESRKALESSNPGFPESSKRDFQFELLTPDGPVLRENVVGVVAPGREGYFGVLSGHEYFATTLKPGILTVKWPDKDRCYELGPGIIQVTPEKVVICAERAKLREIQHK
jgi:F-type H+-transporting ATPase subunit epsilon